MKREKRTKQISKGRRENKGKKEGIVRKIKTQKES
jgi:hypothetical protein